MQELFLVGPAIQDLKSTFFSQKKEIKFNPTNYINLFNKEQTVKAYLSLEDAQYFATHEKVIPRLPKEHISDSRDVGIVRALVSRKLLKQLTPQGCEIENPNNKDTHKTIERFLKHSINITYYELSPKDLEIQSLYYKNEHIELETTKKECNLL